MSKYSKISAKIKNGDYINPIVPNKSIEDYREKEHEINKRFRKDLAEAYETTKHKKEKLLWEISWDEGHSNGLSEVLICYDKLVELLN